MSREAQDIKELLKHAGITEDMLDDEYSGNAKFLCYQIEERWVYVEVTAPNIVELLLGLPSDKQADLITVILRLVPDAGDHQIITDDNQKFSMRAFRLKNSNSRTANLLLIP